MPSKQLPYTSTRSNPLKKKDRVVIIGGGPAGVHMAAILCKRGYKDVTILEKEARVGGKSYTTVDDRGVPHELGTCYLHYLYDPVRSLLREYAPSNREVAVAGERDMRKVFGNDLRGGSDDDFLRGQDFGDFVLAKSEEGTIPRPFWSCCADPIQFLPLYQAFTKYIRLHRLILGDYTYGLPPKPRQWHDLDMTAMQFLEKHGLLAMVGFLRYVQQVQGYGVLEEIPAFYMLWWTHADLLQALLQPFVQREENPITNLTEGWQTLWLNMYNFHVKKHGLKGVFGADVQAVKRGTNTPGNGPCTVQLVVGEAERAIECDKVIFACDMSAFKDKVLDLTPEEHAAFADLHQTTLATTLYEANPVTHEHAVELWFSRMVDSEAQGRLYAHRNSRLALMPKSAPPASGRERRVAYQYLSTPPGPGTPERLRDRLLQDLATSGESGVVVLEQQVWAYMPQYSQQNLKKNHYWTILEQQGSRNCLFIGSSVCFESCLDVVQYNYLVAKMLKL